jgi:CRP/FNR family transcriptional regulator, anaerobic regulatory protein
MKISGVQDNIVPLRLGKLAPSATWSTLVDVCQLLGLDVKVQDIALDALFRHRLLKPGQKAYRDGQTFEALYVVNAGFLKTVMLDSDGIYADLHTSEAIALTDCDLIVIPFKQLMSLGRICQDLEYIICRVVSRQIVHQNVNHVSFGALRSDARVARFLTLEVDRHAAMNFSSQCLRLRMTRRDIGSYLGLTLETVSRSMSALQTAGIIAVDQREIKILRPLSLRYFQDPSLKIVAQH